MPPGKVTYDAAFVTALANWVGNQSFDVRTYMGQHHVLPKESYEHTIGSETDFLVVRAGGSAQGGRLRDAAKLLSQSMGTQVARVAELMSDLSVDLTSVVSLMDRSGLLNNYSVDQFVKNFDDTVTSYETVRTGTPPTPPANPGP
jgi:hypothetical protein